MAGLCSVGIRRQRLFRADDLPEDFEPYTVEEVARYRQDPLVEVERVRAGILGYAAP